MSSSDWTKVTALGAPYALQGEDTQPPTGTKSRADHKFLSRRSVAPFFAAAIVDNGLPLKFPEDTEEDTELGLANRTAPRDPTPPYIPLAKSLQRTLEGLQSDRNIPRLPWHSTNFKASPDTEETFFTPATIPKSCWQQMREDKYSWCEPDMPPPIGVEGAPSGTSKTQGKPHKVYPWNEGRDSELHTLEAMARDGLRMANATIIAFAHLLNGTLNSEKEMSPHALRHTSFVVNDLVHVLAGQFGRLAYKIALNRKLNVSRSLNVRDQQELLQTDIGQDIFGGKWPDIQSKEKAARKETAQKKADADKERRARPTSFRPNQSRESFSRRPQPAQSQTQRPQQQQKQAPRKPAPPRREKTDKDRKGSRRPRGGGSGRRK